MGNLSMDIHHIDTVSITKEPVIGQYDKVRIRFMDGDKVTEIIAYSITGGEINLVSEADREVPNNE